MSLRWVDLDNQKSDYADFAFRKQVPTPVQLFFIYLGFILAGTVLACWVEDKRDGNSKRGAGALGEYPAARNAWNSAWPSLITGAGRPIGWIIRQCHRTS
jgi:hypothetical protein